MTAKSSAGVPTLTLRCDNCGHRVAGRGAAVGWETMWPLAAEVGWTGSPTATGPHRCPRCSAGPHRSAAHKAAAPKEIQPWQAVAFGVHDAAVLELHGELDLSTADDLRRTLTEIGDRYLHAVLDLNDVSLIDSTTIGLFVRAHQAAKLKSGLVCLAAPPRFVIAVLRTMRLDPVFPIFPTWRGAVEWLADGHR